MDEWPWKIDQDHKLLHSTHALIFMVFSAKYGENSFKIGGATELNKMCCICYDEYVCVS